MSALLPIRLATSDVSIVQRRIIVPTRVSMKVATSYDLMMVKLVKLSARIS